MRLVLSLIVLSFLVSCEEQVKPKALPYYGNYDVVTYSKDGTLTNDTVYPKIPKFTYLNQDSVKVSSTQYKGKVWVANFFFTSCPSICPPMMSQMRRLIILTKDLRNDVQFISFSIDPKTDQPSVLRNYIKNNGIETENWVFLTGDEAKTHYMGVHNFMVHAKRNASVAGGFAHSDGMVLVDRDGIVRGIYLGTQTAEVDKLNKDLRKLLKVEYGIVGRK